MRIAELKAQDPFQDPEHVNDNASVDGESREEDGHDRISALSYEITQQYAAVVAALDAIEKGTYGICSVCHELISEDRLKVFPTADTCILHSQKK